MITVLPSESVCSKFPLLGQVGQGDDVQHVRSTSATKGPGAPEPGICAFRPDYAPRTSETDDIESGCAHCGVCTLGAVVQPARTSPREKRAVMLMALRWVLDVMGCAGESICRK